MAGWCQLVETRSLSRSRNVANAQTINVTLNSVNGSSNVVIPMTTLLGDTNGNGAVNASDVSHKIQSGPGGRCNQLPQRCHGQWFD